jgi:hypothetical protein
MIFSFKKSNCLKSKQIIILSKGAENQAARFAAVLANQRIRTRDGVGGPRESANQNQGWGRRSYRISESEPGMGSAVLPNQNQDWGPY